jgi:dihydroorotase
LCSTNPAKILRLKERGTLSPGSIADLTIIDPSCEWTFDAAQSRSKSRNTPFDGRQFTGKTVATIVGGRFVFNEAEKKDRHIA